MQGIGRAVIFASLTVAACSPAPETGGSTADEPRQEAKRPEDVCSARKSVDTIRDQIFDAAIAKVDDKEAIKLNSLRSSISGRLENPVMQSNDPTVDKTQCGARIVFGLPPNTQKAFNDATQLFADIVFTSQPAADKTGMVIETSGTETIVDSLIQGAQKKRTVRVPVADPPARLEPDFKNLFEAGPLPQAANREFGAPLPSAAPASYPSFRCSGGLNRVERLICDIPGLAEQDQIMAEAYRDARGRTAPEQRGRLEAVRQKYLARRNRCEDASCIAATYDAWTSALYDWDAQ